MVRKLILGAVAVVGLTANSGCLYDKGSRDPNVRMRQLLSEDQQGIESGQRPGSNSDQPERIHGGII